jgi:Antimicrobial peptide resistance and lipid A acylation protein PagP
MRRAAALLSGFGLAAMLVAPAVAQGLPTGEPATSPADDAEAHPWPSPVRHLTVQLPGMSHHFDPPLDKHGDPMQGRKFNEKNWGIGLQFERTLEGDWNEWITKTSFGVMKDSLDAMGAYAGHTWQKRVHDGDTFIADLGGGGFLFYRTLRFDGPHRWVPAVLPVLSVTHKPWQLGINLVAVPRCHVSGGTMPNVIYMQFTKAF